MRCHQDVCGTQGGTACGTRAGPLTHAFRRGASAQRVWTRALLFFPSPAALAGHRLQAACWSGLGEGAGAGGSGIRPPARHPCQAQRRCCLSVPSGRGIGQPGEERAHVRPALGSIDSIPLTTLAGSPARGGKCALRETPRPDKSAFVRAGGENVWVLGFLGSVPAPCQSPSAGLTLLGSKGGQPAQRGLREQEAAGRQDCFVSLQVRGAPGRGETWIQMGGWVCFEEDPWEPVLPPGGSRGALEYTVSLLAFL